MIKNLEQNTTVYEFSWLWNHSELFIFFCFVLIASTIYFVLKLVELEEQLTDTNVSYTIPNTNSDHVNEDVTFSSSTNIPALSDDSHDHVCPPIFY